MKKLHFHVYNGGNIGLCNALMSVECGLLIGYLTGRRVIFYIEKPLFNTERGLSLFDLFDINMPFEVRQGPAPAHITKLPANLHNTVLCYNAQPDRAFFNDRPNTIDLAGYDHVEELATMDNQTLAYYSYLFYFPVAKREKAHAFIKNAIQPKERYVQAAKGVLDSIREHYPAGFNSIHVRRTDYSTQPDMRNGVVTAEEILPKMQANFGQDKLLIIHTDEQDENYFTPVTQYYQRNWMIDKSLAGQFPDMAERGLVSLLVAAASECFMGTMGSTFTGIIQRYRRYADKYEPFLYLYSQRPLPVMTDDNQSMLQPAIELLGNGKMKEESFGRYSWNRMNHPWEVKQQAFWYREWPMCYKGNGYVKQNVVVVPDFLDDTTMSHIMTRAKNENTEARHQRENRDRWSVDYRTDDIVREMVRRACEFLGYDIKTVEPMLQVFTQYEGGETFWHTDSVYEDNQGRRLASVLFYLNEDFEGSFIDFPYIGTRVKPKAGMMISYPLLSEYDEQDVRFSHSASIITSGTKTMCYFSIKEKPTIV